MISPGRLRNAWLSSIEPPDVIDGAHVRRPPQRLWAVDPRGVACAVVVLPRAGKARRHPETTAQGLRRGSLSAEFHMCYQSYQQQHRGHP
jgi:hypothetical protein